MYFDTGAGANITGGASFTGGGANGQVTLWNGPTALTGDAGFTYSGTGATFDVAIGRNLTVGGLTSGRVTLTGTAGLQKTDAGFTFSGTGNTFAADIKKSLTVGDGVAGITGSTIFSAVGNAGGTTIIDDGSVTVTVDVGSASHPITWKSGATTVGYVTFDGTLFMNAPGDSVSVNGEGVLFNNSLRLGTDTYLSRTALKTLGVGGSAGDITGSFLAARLTTSAQDAIVIGPYGVAAGQTGESRWLELAANGVKYIGLKAPDAVTAASKVYVLPAAVGSTNDVLALSNATNGTLAWATPHSGTGTNGQVVLWTGTNSQSGDTGFTYSGTGASFVAVVSGNVGVGTPSPTARLHLPAGGTAASSAPLKFTTQANPLTVIEAGTMEYVGHSLQFSQFQKRRGVAMTEQVITTTTSANNDSTETAALITAAHGANYLEVGKMEEIVLRGTISQRSNPAAFGSVRVKYAGVTLLTSTTPVSTTIAAGTPFEIRVSTTCRTTGNPGTLQVNFVFWIDGISNVPDAQVLSNVDTTSAQDTTVTFQWNEANGSDLFSVHQGRVLCIEPNR